MCNHPAADSGFGSLLLQTLNRPPVVVNTTVVFVEAFDISYAHSGSKVTIASSFQIIMSWTDASLLPSLLNGTFSCATHYIPGLLNSYGPRFAAIRSPRTSDVQYQGGDRWYNDMTVVVNTEATWNYALYPYDKQSFDYSFGFSKGNFYFGSCDVAVHNSYASWHELVSTSDRSDFLLSQEWTLPDDGLTANTIEFPLNGLASHCSVRVKINRNPTVYIIKELMLEVLAVLAGLASQQLGGASLDFFAARAAGLITAMLMIINKSE